jgi:hypothetical protein
VYYTQVSVSHSTCFHLLILSNILANFKTPQFIKFQVIWQEKTEELRQKPDHIQLHAPQIPHELNQAWTQSSADKGLWLTTWVWHGLWVRVQLWFSVVYWLSCLPMDTRLMGSNLAKSDRFLRAIKIHSKTSFGGEVKLLAPCCEILQHVKDPWCMTKILIRKIHGQFLWSAYPLCY